MAILKNTLLSLSLCVLVACGSMDTHGSRFIHSNYQVSDGIGILVSSIDGKIPDKVKLENIENCIGNGIKENIYGAKIIPSILFANLFSTYKNDKEWLYYKNDKEWLYPILNEESKKYWVNLIKNKQIYSNLKETGVSQFLIIDVFSSKKEEFEVYTTSALDLITIGNEKVTSYKIHVQVIDIEQKQLSGTITFDGTAYSGAGVALIIYVIPIPIGYPGKSMNSFCFSAGQSIAKFFLNQDNLNQDVKSDSLPHSTGEFVSCMAGGERRWTYRSKCD